MPSDSTSPVLDCSDSPLSITANVVGILTFAYAVLITLFYRSKTLVKAKDESKKYYIRADRVHNSLVEAVKRLEAYFSTLNVKISPEIELLLEDGRYWHFQYKQNMKDLPGFKHTLLEDEKESKDFTRKKEFLFEKEDMDKVIEGMLETRATLDGTYHVLLNSMIVDEIQKQTTAMDVYSQSLSKQKNMITDIMDALNLETQLNPTPQVGLSQKGKFIDMSEMYLRPRVQGNKELPSEKFKRNLEPPYICGCGKSHRNPLGVNRFRCPKSYGEPQFDLEDGLWVMSTPSGTGTEVYFDEDRAKWIKRMQTRRPNEQNEEWSSQNMRKIPRRPPFCVCHQSHIDELSGKSRACPRSYSEPHFDPEKGLWVTYTPAGFEVYFIQDIGEWIPKREYERMQAQSSGEETNERPSQNTRSTLGKPPVCGCGQSNMPNQISNDCICSTVREPYFDPEEGRWRGHSRNGIKVYFDQDSGRWCEHK